MGGIGFLYVFRFSTFYVQDGISRPGSWILSLEDFITVIICEVTSAGMCGIAWDNETHWDQVLWGVGLKATVVENTRFGNN